MKPGTKPTRSNHDGRCLQLSTACAIGVPWRKAAKGWEPDTETSKDFMDTTWHAFYRRWQDELYELGYYARRFYPDGKNEPEGYWIGIVNGGVSRNITHAVTMKGKKLHYDPSANRVHRPHKFHEGYELIPHGDN